jgi:hypothetical protein
MEIHKPKPIRNWREFFSEIGIIVLGVCIALAAEQAAQTLHNRSRAAEARANIREEIAHNLGFMERDHATQACVTRRLDEVLGLIAASAAGKLPQDALWIGAPTVSAMIDGKYKTAIQSGATSLFDDKEQAAYAALYLMFEGFGKSETDEQQHWAVLRTLETHPPASPVLDWELRNALQLARLNRWGMNATRLVAVEQAARIGIKPDRSYMFRGKIVLPECVPLHTSRELALKLTAQPSWPLESP